MGRRQLASTAVARSHWRQQAVLSAMWGGSLKPPTPPTATGPCNPTHPLGKRLHALVAGNRLARLAHAELILAADLEIGGGGSSACTPGFASTAETFINSSPATSAAQLHSHSCTAAQLSRQRRNCASARWMAERLPPWPDVVQLWPAPLALAAPPLPYRSLSRPGGPAGGPGWGQRSTSAGTWRQTVQRQRLSQARAVASEQRASQVQGMEHR